MNQTEMKAFENQINLTLLEDMISFVVKTADATRQQKQLLEQRCMFPIRATSVSRFQERYGFLYLGELLERYEERFGMSAPDRRAIALALGYTRDIAVKEMFVGSQRTNFIQAVERDAQGDVYLTGALYLLSEEDSGKSAYEKRLAERQYIKTEELIFVMSLFDTEQALTRFKSQLALLLGSDRTMPVLENTRIFGWLVAKLFPLKKLLRAKELAAVRALLALPVSFVKQGSKPYDYLLAYGYQPLEIIYANMSAIYGRWLNDGLHSFGLAAEKIAVELFRTVLQLEEPLPAAVYPQLTEFYTKYSKFEVKYCETHKLADVLKADVRIKNAEVMAWFIGRESLSHPAVSSFDILDTKWDALSSALGPDVYLRLFENSLSSEMEAAELEQRIKRYNELTQGSYLDCYRKYQSGRCFSRLVSTGLIDLWTEFQNSLPGKDTASPSMLHYIGRYVSGIETIQAFHFLQKFMPQYGYAGLKEFFSRFDNDFSNGFDRQLWEERSYSGANVSLMLKRGFLADDPDGQLLLLHWADEYFFTIKPTRYLEFIQAVLENDYASGLLPWEELRTLFDFLRTQSKLSAYDTERLKQRYFTSEELQADHEARSAERLKQERRAHDEKAQRIRTEYEGISGRTFEAVWKFLNGYQYLREEQAIAAQTVQEELAWRLDQAGSALKQEDCPYFLRVCANLLEFGAMDWAQLRSHISSIKEVLSHAPSDDSTK